jgi:hypothetical protein
MVIRTPEWQLLAESCLSYSAALEPYAAFGGSDGFRHMGIECALDPSRPLNFARQSTRLAGVTAVVANHELIK